MTQTTYLKVIIFSTFSWWWYFTLLHCGLGL